MSEQTDMAGRALDPEMPTIDRLHRVHMWMQTYFDIHQDTLWTAHLPFPMYKDVARELGPQWRYCQPVTDEPVSNLMVHPWKVVPMNDMFHRPGSRDADPGAYFELHLQGMLVGMISLVELELFRYKRSEAEERENKATHARLMGLEGEEG